MFLHLENNRQSKRLDGWELGQTQRLLNKHWPPPEEFLKGVKGRDNVLRLYRCLDSMRFASGIDCRKLRKLYKVATSEKFGYEAASVDSMRIGHMTRLHTGKLIFRWSKGRGIKKGKPQGGAAFTVSRGNAACAIVFAWSLGRKEAGAHIMSHFTGLSQEQCMKELIKIFTTPKCQRVAKTVRVQGNHFRPERYSSPKKYSQRGKNSKEQPPKARKWVKSDEDIKISLSFSSSSELERLVVETWRAERGRPFSLKLALWVCELVYAKTLRKWCARGSPIPIIVWHARECEKYKCPPFCYPDQKKGLTAGSDADLPNSHRKFFLEVNAFAREKGKRDVCSVETRGDMSLAFCQNGDIQRFPYAKINRRKCVDLAKLILKSAYPEFVQWLNTRERLPGFDSHLLLSDAPTH